MIGFSVSEFSKVSGASHYEIRKAIREGFITVDRSVRPMTIVNGEMPVKLDEWRKQLRSEMESAGVPAGNYGFSNDKMQAVDRLGNVFSVKFSKLPASLRESVNSARVWARRF